MVSSYREFYGIEKFTRLSDNYVKELGMVPNSGCKESWGLVAMWLYSYIG